MILGLNYINLYKNHFWTALCWAVFKDPPDITTEEAKTVIILELTEQTEMDNR